MKYAFKIIPGRAQNFKSGVWMFLFKLSYILEHFFFLPTITITSYHLSGPGVHCDALWGSSPSVPPLPTQPPIPALPFFHFVPCISCCSLNSDNGDQPQDIYQSCDFLSGQLFPQQVPVLTPPCSFFFRASLTCDFQRPLQPFCNKPCKCASPSLCSFLVLFCIF